MKAQDHTIIYGSLLLGIGLFVRYLIGKRKFQRRGVAGLQQFPSYGYGVVIRFMETLILFIGNLCLLGGLLLLALAGFNHHFKF
ncbi:hypothetical protein ACFS5N_05725 [Mucilaginibacter ximonensis]|uniref:Molybdenum ABC transporter permease n=1 Tax=Mucilaginibacter ximonensis TaxID=538021 RepID=A0ABW5Y9I0_9SPHI